MKTYRLNIGPSTSKIASTLVALSAEGKPGEVLVRSGFSQANFSLFLARLALKAVAAKYDERKLSELFEAVACGNCSQAKQALGEAEIFIDGGEKPKSLSAHWGAGGRGAVSVSSIIDGL